MKNKNSEEILYNTSNLYLFWGFYLDDKKQWHSKYVIGELKFDRVIFARDYYIELITDEIDAKNKKAKKYYPIQDTNLSENLNNKKRVIIRNESSLYKSIDYTGFPLSTYKGKDKNLTYSEVIREQNRLRVLYEKSGRKEPNVPPDEKDIEEADREY